MTLLLVFQALESIARILFPSGVLLVMRRPPTKKDLTASLFVGRTTVWWCLPGLSVVCTPGLCSFAIEKAVRVGDKICEQGV